MMATSTQNPVVANEAADEIIALITELHATAYQPMRAMYEDARRRACEPDKAMYALATLAIGCGLSTLAQHAARLQEAAENKKYARAYWARVVYN